MRISEVCLVSEPVRLYRWDEIALEKVTEVISRKFITELCRPVVVPQRMPASVSHIRARQPINVLMKIFDLMLLEHKRPKHRIHLRAALGDGENRRLLVRVATIYRS